MSAGRRLASVPTLIKSYREPATENYWPYLAPTANGAIAMLTITTWQFSEYAFPAYLALIFVTISVLIIFPHLRFRNTLHDHEPCALPSRPGRNVSA